MNKYFLPVYHSELKPWIKWWILKRLGGGQSSLKAVTLSSGTLTKVDKSKALSIKEYYGNTVQDGTPTPESPVPVQTISGNITFTINGGDYRIDLGEIELCKIGDYKDKIVNDNGTWKIEKKVGKVVLNGGEYWWFNINSGVSGVGFAATAISSKNSEDYGDGLCNYFQNNKSGKAMNSVRFGANDKALYFYIDNTVFTTLDIWKTWLSTHNITVYYQLATPTTETITNTNLISQLNALYEFYVESRTVSISNNSEIPFEVLLEYYGR